MSGSTSANGTVGVFGAGTELPTALQSMLMGGDIQPGSMPSYELCKQIFLYHALGAKMTAGPVSMAMSQPRTITVQDGPEESLVEAFQAEWKALGCDRAIAEVMTLARVYGVATLSMGVVGGDPSDPVDYRRLPDAAPFFSVLDPLNTAGSLVLNQDPNSADFMKVLRVDVQGKPYHPSRTVVVMNEQPIYIAFTGSGFGYVGRSVYQRALFPLKSFIRTMSTDDMVATKAGLLIAKMKQAGSIVDRLMVYASAVKRALLLQGQTGNVLTIGLEDEVSSLDLQNIDKSMATARTNILTNIATAADMPAKLLTQETFAEGFGEGTEDAAVVVRYLNRLREEMEPLYVFLQRVVMHRAWSPAFYRTIQSEFPDYASKPYQQAFYEWANSFNSEWPSLVEEKESEAIKVDESKLKAVTDLLAALKEDLGPANKARLIKWAADNFNTNKRLFSSPLVLDWDDVVDDLAQAEQQAQQQAMMGGGVGGPQPGQDASASDPRSETPPQSQSRPGGPIPGAQPAVPTPPAPPAFQPTAAAAG